MIGLRRPPHLAAPDPPAWLATHESAGDAEALGLPEVTAALPATFDRLVEHGTPPPASALYLSGWFAGGIAGAIGVGLALGGVGFLVRADEIRWTMHPGGWPERTSLGAASALVLADHPWAGIAEVAATPEELLDRTVAALVDASAPIVAACRRLTTVGWAGLWNEVGDGLGCAVAWRPDLPVDAAMHEVLAAAVRVPSAPWKATTDLRFAAASFGPVPVAQKGGCCLAYTAPGSHRCTACSLHTPDECDALCVAWFENERHP